MIQSIVLLLRIAPLLSVVSAAAAHVPRILWQDDFPQPMRRRGSRRGRRNTASAVPASAKRKLQELLDTNEGGEDGMLMMMINGVKKEQVDDENQMMMAIKKAEERMMMMMMDQEEEENEEQTMQMMMMEKEVDDNGMMMMMGDALNGMMIMDDNSELTTIMGQDDEVDDDSDRGMMMMAMETMAPMMAMETMAPMMAMEMMAPMMAMDVMVMMAPMMKMGVMTPSPTFRPTSGQATVDPTSGPTATAAIVTESPISAPTGAPISPPTPAPVAPTAAPVARTAAPIAPPTQAPIAPTAAPIAPPTQAPIAPTAAPIAPTAAPIAPPTQAPIAPTAAPIAPTAAPIAPPTQAPIAPTAAPIAPTAAPIAPTAAPIAPPTQAPIAPTAAPIAPTTAPTTPVPSGVPSLGLPPDSPFASPLTPTALISPAGPPVGSPINANQPLNLRIIHVNDHHSHLEEDKFDIESGDPAFPSNCSETETINVPYGGYPLLVSLIMELREETINSLGLLPLLLHAGDAITGTSFFTLFEGLADARMMQAVCFDAFALGNHEFDNGDQGLFDFITDLEDSNDCFTPVLSANLFPNPDSPLRELERDGFLLPAVVRRRAGRDVGIIGVTIAQKTLLSSSPDPGTVLTDEVAAVSLIVSILESQNVDIIIVVSHIGYDRDVSELALISGVDVVVGGDSHTLLGDLDPVSLTSSGGPYPTLVQKADGTTTCVVQAWEYAHLVGVLDIEFSPDGDVVECTGTAIAPIDVGGIEVEDTGPDGSTVPRSLSESQLEELVEILESEGRFRSVIPDPATQTTLDGFVSQVAVLQQTVIGFVPDDICYERIPAQGRSVICEVCDSFPQGGGACNLVAQAFLFETPTADVAIQNAGGCRTDIAAGPFTIDDAITLLPFSNTIVVITMTGAEIELVLEQALDFAFTGESTGAYPYASGLRYDVDRLASFGSRITNLEINPRLNGDFEPIDLTAVYQVATHSFLASGRDGYTLFGQLPSVDTFTEYSQIFVDYVRSVETVVEPPLENFSTQSFTSLIEPDCDMLLNRA